VVWPRSPLAFASFALMVGVVLRLALGAARDGPERWWAVFGTDPEAQNEYLPALAALHSGVGTFLDRFAEVALTLPIHPSGHPPGVLLTLHWLGIEEPKGAALLAVAGGALTVPLAYLLARELLEERRARIATLLVLLAPSTLLYGVTSFDALFAAVGTATAALLVSRRAVARAAGGPALAVGSFFSFALLGVGWWAVLMAALRRGVGSGLRLAAWSGAAVVGFYGLLYALTGLDPVGTVEAASDAYALGISGARPYWYWLVGSPVAFFVAAGLPIAWYALRALGRGVPAAVALAALVAIAALLGFTKAETERIWLFMVPLAAVAAA
jgi:methylthioxylose transferase